MVFTQAQTSTMVRPHWISEAHWKELIEGSAIDPSIASRNWKTLVDAREVDFYLNRNTNRKWKHSEDLVPCWVVTGVSPDTGETTYEGLQVKPDKPRPQLEKGQAKTDTQGNIKYRKYESPADAPLAPLFLDTGDPDYWPNVQTDVRQIRVHLEGAKKAAAGLTAGYASISLPGVWCGQKSGELHPRIKEGCGVGRIEVLAFDMDMLTNVNVLRALDQYGRLLSAEGSVVRVAMWDSAHKGLDDLLKHSGVKAVKEAIDNAIPFEKWRKQMEVLIKGSEPTKSKRPPQAIEIAAKLAEQYRHELAWDTTGNGRWFRYAHKTPGVWAEVPDEIVHQVVMAGLEAEGVRGYALSYLKAVIAFLKIQLAITEWNESPGYIPFINGVLELRTNHLQEHNPGLRLLWSLPFKYKNPKSDRTALIKECQPIWDWLVESVGGPENESIAHVLVAYLAAVVRGRVDLQRYLECIGRAGSGKGTFVRLATAIVGADNTAATTLTQLETSRFELKKVANAKLAAISEAEGYAKDTTVLKSLTGQDLLSQEEKGVQERAGQGKYAKCMVILAGERPPAGMESGGVVRRRLTVYFRNSPDAEDRRDLLGDREGKMSGEFVPYLPAFLNLVLSYSDQEITDLVRNTSVTVPRLAYVQAEMMLATNSLAQWADESLVWTEEVDPTKGLPKYSVQIGRAERNREKDGKAYLRQDVWLYPNYRAFCEESGIYPVSLQNFRSSLDELFNSICKLKIQFFRDSKGSTVYGIRLKGDGDPVDGCITGEYVRQMESRAARYKAKKSGKTPQSVTENDEPMTDETPSVVGVETDDYLSNQSKNLEKETNNMQNPQTCSDEFCEMPQSPSKPTQPSDSVQQPSANSNTTKADIFTKPDEEPTAEVGDRVLIKVGPYEEWMSDQMREVRGVEQYPTREYKDLQRTKNELLSVTSTLLVKAIDGAIATVHPEPRGKAFRVPVNCLAVLAKSAKSTN